MSDAPKSEKPRLSGRARILLFVSLALNLAVVGILAGAMLGRDRHDLRQPPMRDFGFGPYGRALSQADRKELAQALAGHAGDLRNNRVELRRQMTSILQIIRTTPFDGAELAGVLRQQRSNLVDLQDIGQRLLLERLEAMTDIERAAFADRLEKSVRKGPGNNKDKKAKRP